MIIVTGGAGFIGSNLVKELNNRGHSDILIVDNLTNPTKSKNIQDLNFIDYMDKWDFEKAVAKVAHFGRRSMEFVFHQGARSTMLEPDGKYLMNTNFEFSKTLLHYCSDTNTPLMYASSVAVYNYRSKTDKYESPRNLYGVSKLLFDRYVSWVKPNNKVVGLRYFCVYGSRDSHKLASNIISEGYQQLKNGGVIFLFKGFGGYGDGQHERDFTYVEDIVDVNLWAAECQNLTGIFEVGTGQARRFNEVAKEVVKFHGSGKIEYIEPSKEIIPSYICSSVADMSELQARGYHKKFKSIEEGIPLTLSKWEAV